MKQDKNILKWVLWIVITFIILLLYSNLTTQTKKSREYKICSDKCIMDFDICMIKGGILKHEDSTNLYIECEYELEICVDFDCFK